MPFILVLFSSSYQTNLNVNDCEREWMNIHHMNEWMNERKEKGKGEKKNERINDDDDYNSSKILKNKKKKESINLKQETRNKKKQRRQQQQVTAREKIIWITFQLVKLFGEMMWKKEAEGK